VLARRRGGRRAGRGRTVAVAIATVTAVAAGPDWTANELSRWTSTVLPSDLVTVTS